MRGRARQQEPGEVGGEWGHVEAGAPPRDVPVRSAPVSFNAPLPGLLARADKGPFVGRTGALRRLQARWRGESGLAICAGEPGIGKTRLAARFASSVHGDGALVLYGRADEESVSPYQPFVEALRHYAGHCPNLMEETRLPEAGAEALGSLVPELGVPAVGRRRSEHERLRHQLFEAVVRLLLDAAKARRLLLVLEDLHWADVPTILLLRQLLRRSAGVPLLVIASYSDVDAERSAPLARLVADLRREADLELIRLGGLRRSEIAALISARLGPDATDETLVKRLSVQTGGNPFFIEELLRTSTEPSGGALPPGVKDVIGRRLDRLPPPTLDTLTVAAALGTDFRLSTLAAVASDRDEDELIAALEQAVAAGLVVEDQEEVDRFSFSHALVRQTLYGRPIASRRLRLHLRIAQALEAVPLPVHPAELAHHYFQAREVGGAPKAIVFGLKAAEACQAAHAYEDAVAHYERALKALEIVRRDDAAARCDVLLALGAARWQASEPDPRSTFAQAVELARGLGSPDRLSRAVLGAGGRFYAPGATDRTYIELLQEALAALEPGDSTLRVRLLARLAENLVFEHPGEPAGARAAEALEMARRLGEPYALAVALMARHAALLHAAHAHERRRICEQALAVAGELRAVELEALGRHWLLYDLVELGDLDEARRRHAELEGLSAELQQPLYRHSSLAWSCVWAGLAGRFEEAERTAHASVRLAEHARAPEARMHLTAQLLAIRREQGRLDELLPAIECFASDEPTAAAWRSLLPLAHLDGGDRSLAEEVYERAIEGGGPETMPRTMLWLTAAAALAEAATELGDVARSARLHAALEPYADHLIQWGFTGNAGSVHRVLGRTAAVAGWHDRAQDHFEAALERHTALGAEALLARTRCDYGELLLHGPPADRPRGRDLLHEAGGAARRLGMRGVAARAERHC
jgi:tetratricopeptide (TPR) repeat protein